MRRFQIMVLPGVLFLSTLSACIQGPLKRIPADPPVGSGPQRGSHEDPVPLDKRNCAEISWESRGCQNILIGHNNDIRDICREALSSRMSLAELNRRLVPWLNDPYLDYGTKHNARMCLELRSRQLPKRGRKKGRAS